MASGGGYQKIGCKMPGDTGADRQKAGRNGRSASMGTGEIALARGSQMSSRITSFFPPP